MTEPLLKVQNLSRHFGSGATAVRAVDDVSFEIARGETVGLVGESGCGKTSLVRTLLKLGPATSGSVLLDGVEITGASGRQLHDLRRQMQVVFQDPYQSLNPRLRVHRESVSVALGQLRRAGILAIDRKHIRILDRARLERASRERD